MTTDVSSHGPGMLMGMLHMPTLVSSTATDSPLMMFSSPAAAADGFGQPAHAAMSSGMSDSQMDVVHSDAAAAQLLESQAGLTLAAQEAALNQLKRACKAAKSAPKKKGGLKKQQLVCKVDGCGAHLGTSKAYYQRHKVCAVHLSSMCAKVNGIDSRFCQQCGKFQPLDEFDADKRSCRARLKRHNNRRREQRHNKSYEFALELRCQAAAQLLGIGDDEEGFEPYYAQQALPGPFGPGRFAAQYHPHQFGLAAGFTPTDSASNLAAAAAAGGGSQEQQQFQQSAPQQFQQQGLGGMLSRWAGLDCLTAVSPKPGKINTGEISISAGGGMSEGTTAGQHGSPNISPDADADAAAAAASAAAAAVGTPTSRRPGMRRVSANRALEALRTMNSSYSTESDWDDESEDGGRSPAAWQQRRLGHPGASRLQGSRLKAAGSMAAPRSGPLGQSDLVPHLGHLLPTHMLDGTPALGQGAQGFRGLNPASSMPQQAQWGEEYADMHGWEGSLAEHLHAQQGQEQQWGSACHGSSGGGASYDNTYISGQHMGHMSSAGGCSGPMQQHPALSHQHSAPAGICYHSRSNSPAISTGGNVPGLGAAAGPGPSILGPRKAGLQHSMHGGSLQSQWSLPAHPPAGHDFYPAGGEGPMHLQDHMPHGLDAGQLLSGMQQALGPGSDAHAFGSMQPHELQQVLEGLLPGGMGHAGQFPPSGPMGGPGAEAGFPDQGACGMGSQGQPGAHMNDLQHCSPPEPSRGGFGTFEMFSAGADGTSQAAMFMARPQAVNFRLNERQLSPQSSMTAAAAAAAAAIMRGGFAAAVARQRSQQTGMQEPGLQQVFAQDNVLRRRPASQQQHMVRDLPCSDERTAGLAAALAAAGGHVSSSPDSSSGGGTAGGAAGMLMGACAGLQHLRTDSQGTSVLREELAGVALGSDPWQQQMQGPDMHMADAADMLQQMQDMQYEGQHGQHSTPSQSGSPVGGNLPAEVHFSIQVQDSAAGGGCAEQDAQEQHVSQQQSPTADFDSVDTAAAAATFEAQLAACCGNKESQEAVFKAWLDALLPNSDEQPAPQHRQSQQTGSASASPTAQEQSFDQQQDEDGAQQQQAEAPDGNLPEFASADVDAAAAALQLAVQDAAEEGLGQAPGDSLNPEEDFKELLDLLLDA